MKDAILDYMRSSLPAGWAWEQGPAYHWAIPTVVVGTVREPAGPVHMIYIDQAEARLRDYAEWLRSTLALECEYAQELPYVRPARPEPKLSFRGRNPLLGEENRGDDEPVY